ncbi:hypothetical protein [Demequina sp.]|uniref:hypothetical protein n=1 Tax=Demequina sp. TaxID=2050685 RepID=UPI0025F10F58|nr:hypothetical protein [Demequina sp.]
MKRPLPLIAAGLLATALALTACTSPTSTPSSTSVTSASPTSSRGGHVLPVDANPIVNPATAAGLDVTDVLLEDNTDPSGAAISDRLQFTVRNTSGAPLSGLEAFYTMTDTTTGASESYFLAMPDLTVPAGGETTVYVDGESGAGHYPENIYSVYRTSLNQVDVTVEVSATGVAPATGLGSKSAGAGEQAD